MNLKDLKAPFPSKRISWRIGRAGKNSSGKIWVKCLAYFDARDGMDRLDEVVGPGQWQDEYRKVGAATICRLGISFERGPDGQNIWVWKEDASDETDIDAVKGGMSGSFKRACVKWGIGRYLYDLEEGFGTVVDQNTKGAIYAKTNELGVFYWLPPQLPDFALPESERASKPQETNVRPIIQYVPPSQVESLRLATKEELGLTENDLKEVLKAFGATGWDAIPVRDLAAIKETLKRKASK